MKFGLGFLFGALFIALVGCTSVPHGEYVHGEWLQTAFVTSCIDETVELYHDLCQESSSGYEEMDGADAHFDGAKCAAESIRDCVGDWSGGL